MRLWINTDTFCHLLAKGSHQIIDLVMSQFTTSSPVWTGNARRPHNNTYRCYIFLFDLNINPPALTNIKNVFADVNSTLFFGAAFKITQQSALLLLCRSTDGGIYQSFSHSSHQRSSTSSGQPVPTKLFLLKQKIPLIKNFSHVTWCWSQALNTPTDYSFLQINLPLHQHWLLF